MNQDFDSNDSRDGDRRSSGRRDDDRNRGERRNDGPRFNRSSNTDRRDASAPRYNRDNDRPNRPIDRRNDGPRPDFNRNRPTDNRSGGADDRRPRFDRDNSRGGDAGDRTRPRFNRDDNDRTDRRPSRPSFDRGRDENRSGDRRPSFDRNRPDGDRPRFNREPRSDNFNSDKPRFDRGNDRPNQDNRPGDQRFTNRRDRDDEARPRFNRDDRDRRDDKPQFERNDRPRFERDGDRRDAGATRFNREPRSDNSNSERPRFNRDNDRPNRPAGSRDRNDRQDKPAFKRVGGFQRDADERNRFGGDDRRNSRNEPKRFSPEQRKESGERRTGFYTKAPNYDLEEKRHNAPMQRRERQEGDQPKRKAADDGLTRLNRYIANSGVCSRREADELIARGDISVNGKVVTEMGYKVKEGDTVKYGTKTLNPERFVYVLLNKPKDYITTTDDPEERKTVMELVADAGNFRMYPVGRLDRNTTGLLLLTNDGELADKLTHPSHNVRKIYQVEIDKPITDEHFEAIKRGVELEDGLIKPDALSIVTPDAHVIGIEIHSGRNRIVRRIFEHLGYEVTKLDRTTYAGLTKKDLPRGKWRFLDPKEVVKLKYFN
ncbi:pseudouridine synthase [Spirosoma knui]